jgi:hypothetical protein
VLTLEESQKKKSYAQTRLCVRTREQSYTLTFQEASTVCLKKFTRKYKHQDQVYVYIFFLKSTKTIDSESVGHDHLAVLLSFHT